MNRRRLYRCSHDQRIAGVAAGVAEYLDVDPTLVRVLWIASIFFGGLGLLLYVVMAIVVPLEPVYGGAPAGDPSVPTEGSGEATEGAAPTGWQVPYAGHRHQGGGGSGIGMTFVGIVLVLFGALALADRLLPVWADQGRFLWPAFILGIGALLVVTSLRRHPNEL